MRPRLGLVCITQSKDVRYHMVTRKRLLELPPDGQRKLLDEIYRDNIQTFNTALRYCERESISLYRILSSIFPFADEDVGRETLQPLSDALADAGRYALERGIRLVMHPDQFVVLSSDSAGVVANSVKILTFACAAACRWCSTPIITSSTSGCPATTIRAWPRCWRRRARPGPTRRSSWSTSPTVATASTTASTPT